MYLYIIAGFAGPVGLEIKLMSSKLSLSLSLSLSVRVYTYTHVYMYMCVCIYIYIYIYIYPRTHIITGFAGPIDFEIKLMS